MSIQPGAMRQQEQPGSLLWGRPSAPAAPSPIDKLEEERAKALERLESLRTYYDRPDAAQLLQQFQQRAGGQDQAINQSTQQGMFAANADASAGQLGSERDMIRQQFSNAGLGGSGMEASAMITSRRRAGAQARAGRREITSRAALENFQARERAQQQVAQYLRDRQQAEQAAGMAEVDFRSQMREITDDQGAAGPVEKNYGGIANGPWNNFGKGPAMQGVNPSRGGGGGPNILDFMGGGGRSVLDMMQEQADPFVPSDPKWGMPNGPRAAPTPGGGGRGGTITSGNWLTKTTPGALEDFMAQAAPRSTPTPKQSFAASNPTLKPKNEWGGKPGFYKGATV